MKAYSTPHISTIGSLAELTAAVGDPNQNDTLIFNGIPSQNVGSQDFTGGAKK